MLRWKTSLKKEKRNYDLRSNVVKFKVGDAVYLLDKRPPKKGKSKKLQPVWVGPYIVTACLSPYTFVIKVRAKGYQTVSHDLIKHCHSTSLPSWIQNMKESLISGKEVAYCVYKKPQYGEMVMCDRCNEWFHLACVGLNRKSVKALKSFFCPACAQI